MLNAAYMALTVIAWAAAIGMAGSVVLAIVTAVLMIYEDFFRH